MYKAAIFDLDGTILNTDLYIVANYIRLFKKYAPEKMPTLEDMVYFSGPPLTDVFKKYMPDLDHEVLKKDFVDWSINHANPLSFVYKDEMEVLNNLKNKGIKLGLVTNKSERAMISALTHFKLLSLFDSTYSLEKCLYKKPDPWPILECMKDLKCEKSDTIYIGDDISDIVAGKRAKVDTGLVHFGLKEVKDADPTYDFYSYKDIERRILNGTDDK